jgi:hypothetical protein
MLGMPKSGCPQICMEVMGQIRFLIDSAQVEALIGNTFLAKTGTLASDGKPARPEGYGLQVSAFSTLENAAMEIQAIQNAGFSDVFMQCTQKAGAGLYRVLVGNFDTRDKAVNFKETLFQAGFAAIPVKHN